MKSSRRRSPDAPAVASDDAGVVARALDTSTEEDRQLVARSIYGDTNAFAQLVAKYQDRTLAIARHFVYEEEAARDVAQEAFLRVYRSLHQFDLTMRFYTWFYRIVVHLAIDHLRRQRRSPMNVGDFRTLRHASPGGSSDRVERMETSRDVHRVLRQVPESYRQLLVLRDFEGFTSKEISDIAGWNHATVRWRLHRARQIFRELWEAEGLSSDV
ncbi:MAG: RNA polymerase sigma factor [Planctomycetota bacterium]